MSKSNQPTVESIAKMQLNAIQQCATILAQLNEVPKKFEVIKQEVEEAAKELGYNIKVKELETKEAIERLEQSVYEKEKEVKEKIDKLQQDYKDKQIIYERELEKIDYNNRLAVRNNDITAAETIAKEYKLRIIKEEYLIELQQNELTQEKIDKLISDTKAEVTKSINANHSFEVRGLEQKYTTQIQLLTKELEMTKAELTKAESIIAKQDNLIANHGNNIKEALAAAKVSLQLPSDNNKR